MIISVIVRYGYLARPRFLFFLTREPAIANLSV